MKAENTLTLSEEDIIECIRHSLSERGIIPDEEDARIGLESLAFIDSTPKIEATVSFKVEPVKPRRRRKNAGTPVETQEGIQPESEV